MIKGNDIIFLLDGSPVAACKSCEFDESALTIETVNSQSGIYRTNLVTKKAWQLTSNHLVSSLPLFHNMVGKSFSIIIKHREDSDSPLYGNVICTKAKVTATRGNMAQGSFSFIGNGALTTNE